MVYYLGISQEELEWCWWVNGLDGAIADRGSRLWTMSPVIKSIAV